VVTQEIGDTWLYDLGSISQPAPERDPWT
jgi:hypothetical protein